MRALTLLIFLRMVTAAASAAYFPQIIGQDVVWPGKTLTVSASGGAMYANISAAKAAALAGDTIEVHPGTYLENNLLKNGVNYVFYPGATLVWVDPVTGGAGYGFFDDRATGATTNRILGAVDF